MSGFSPLAAAVEAFQRGEGGYRKLAAKYGVSEEALRAECRPGSAPKRQQLIPKIPTRVEWLAEQLAAIEDKALNERGATAYTQLVREARIIRGMLDEEMARVAAEQEIERQAKLSAVPPDERRVRLRERAEALADDDLEVFVRTYLDRHGGRVELRVVQT